ncbi:NAD(P)-dependent oxidoreductase [Sphingomonas sp.]|uniref:precorrin-2 dehydrogenase/sirohydrochlorin ferrochelatase family protein n=1 Tax=Sphingomonas sp. TaxID=28214 RepID=UPI003AFFFBF4
MTWPGLPILVKLDALPVVLLGTGEAADAKRRLLERAGATVVTDAPAARLAVVAIEDEVEAVAAVARLRARGILVNAVDRPELCDFTLPAVVDRAPVLVAVMTGGVSAGLAAALRQRLEALLPSGVGRLAEALFAARGQMRARWPDPAARRRAIGAALAAGGVLDLLSPDPDMGVWLNEDAVGSVTTDLAFIRLSSPDPDDLTLRHARALAQADRVYHTAAVPPAILARARADAPRIASAAPPGQVPAGANVWIGMA